jgi:hypothetical protein
MADLFIFLILCIDWSGKEQIYLVRKQISDSGALVSEQEYLVELITYFLLAFNLGLVFAYLNPIK